MMMKVSVFALLALSLGADAFVAPNSIKSNNAVVLQALNGPQNGGIDGSNYLPGQYGLVGRDSPWGNRNPNAGVPPVPGQTDMPSHLGGTNESNFYQSPSLPTTPGPGQMAPAGGMTPSAMKVAKGQIYTVTGGNLGSTKYLNGGAATKWTGTPHAEPMMQREDSRLWENKAPVANPGSLMPKVAPLAKGQIQEVMGGNRGASKFVKGSATKWAGTKWEEPNHS